MYKDICKRIIIAACKSGNSIQEKSSWKAVDFLKVCVYKMQ